MLLIDHLGLSLLPVLEHRLYDGSFHLCDLTFHELLGFVEALHQTFLFTKELELDHEVIVHLVWLWCLLIETSFKLRLLFDCVVSQILIENTCLLSRKFDKIDGFSLDVLVD